MSVLWAFGDYDTRRSVERAIDTAEAAIVELLEAEATIVRRGHGGLNYHDGDGLIIASFDHHTSRHGDPNLHRHLVVANASTGPDGRTTGIDTRQLYGIRYTAEAVFQSVLRHELTRSQGLLFTEIDRHGVGEIVGIAEQNATYSRRDVIRHVARSADDGIGFTEMMDRTNDYLDGPHAIERLPGVYTTPEIMALENRAANRAICGRSKGICAVAERPLRAALHTRRHLADEQRELVTGATQSGDAITVVVGKAGAGKTTALDAVRDAYERDGYRVIGAALAARAADELRSGAGIPSQGLADLLVDHVQQFHRAAIDGGIELKTESPERARW